MGVNVAILWRWHGADIALGKVERRKLTGREGIWKTRRSSIDGEKTTKGGHLHKQQFSG